MEKNNLFDFSFTSEHALKIYPNWTKKQAFDHLRYIRRKLKKPKAGLLLASEYARVKGLSLEQLHSII